jgi:hypothetical protein
LSYGRSPRTHRPDDALEPSGQVSVLPNSFTCTRRHPAEQ